MDIVSIGNILEQLKQKGLDVVQVELLKNAYEMQNKNLEQLKENNQALRESNTLFKEKIGRLEEEIGGLRKENESLRNDLPVKSKVDGLSNGAVDFLKLCKRLDATRFVGGHMIAALKKGKVEGERIISELRKYGFIVQSKIGVSFGSVEWSLTPKGLEYVAGLEEGVE